jgi:hypothetical protein
LGPKMGVPEPSQGLASSAERRNVSEPGKKLTQSRHSPKSSPIAGKIKTIPASVRTVPVLRLGGVRSAQRLGFFSLPHIIST